MFLTSAKFSSKLVSQWGGAGRFGLPGRCHATAVGSRSSTFATHQRLGDRIASGRGTVILVSKNQDPWDNDCLFTSYAYILNIWLKFRVNVQSSHGTVMGMDLSTCYVGSKPFLSMIM